MWIAAIIALLVGGVAGYLLGWNLGPSETETVTVTNTVTESVEPAAYTAGRSIEAQVAFDGKACMYSGPAEWTAGTVATIRYTATVSGSAMIIWRVLPGTTYEEVVEATSTRAANDPPPFMTDYEVSGPENTRQQTLVPTTLDEGLWVMSCATNPETSTNEVFLSTMVRVLPA